MHSHIFPQFFHFNLKQIVLVFQIAPLIIVIPLILSKGQRRSCWGALTDTVESRQPGGHDPPKHQVKLRDHEVKEWPTSTFAAQKWLLFFRHPSKLCSMY